MDELTFKSYEDLIKDIKQNISVFSSHNFDLVIGIPRSGMIPAYLVSAFLNIDCCDVDSFILNKSLQRGITRKTKGNLELPQEAKKILLLDDSIYSGESMLSILKKIPVPFHERITKGAIYTSGNGKNIADVFVMNLVGKKLFEWGIYHNSIISNTCFDLDGVLCEDCTIEQNDDGEKYIDFIKNASPLFVPTGQIFAIITNRLEKYRQETESWLKKHNVDYKQLIMLNLPDKASREKIDGGIDHKGKLYRKMPAELFIESSYNQAVSIAKTSGKPVYCVDENIFLTPKLSEAILKNTNGVLKSKYYSLKHQLKPYLGWIVGKK